jgi:hypothetical protein
LARQKIDWQLLLKKYTNPQSVKDLDRFLDALPLNAGYNALIAAGLAWLLAGTAVVFASIESGKISELHSELLKVEALKPPVPVISYIPIQQSALKGFAKKIENLYPGISIKSAKGILKISGDLRHYAQFRGVISHVQSGGKSWNVDFKKLCVGRECKGPELQADLIVRTIKIKDAPKK